MRAANITALTRLAHNTAAAILVDAAQEAERTREEYAEARTRSENMGQHQSPEKKTQEIKRHHSGLPWDPLLIDSLGPDFDRFLYVFD